MAKSRKLLLYLAVIALLLWGFWLLMGRPSFSAQGALHRIESANLAPKSRLISASFLHNVDSSGINYRRYMAAGVTDTYLHMTELRKGAFLWHVPDLKYSLLSLPLEDGPMAGLAPDYWPFDYNFFLYTPQPAESWIATVTIGDQSYTTEGACDPSGFTLFSFPQLEDCEEAVGDNLKAHAYDMLNIHYDEDNKTMDIALAVVLYDSANKEIARTVREYPAD